MNGFRKAEEHYRFAEAIMKKDPKSLTQEEKRQVRSRLGNLLFERAKMLFNDMMYSKADRMLEEALKYHITKVSSSVTKRIKCI